MSFISSHVELSSSSHFGSGIVPVDGVGRILYGHCLYHASPFCSIRCIFFHQSIFLHLILYLLFPRLFQPSSSSFTTAHFKFQSLRYHILIFFPQNIPFLNQSSIHSSKPYHLILLALAILSKDSFMPNMPINFSLYFSI